MPAVSLGDTQRMGSAPARQSYHAGLTREHVVNAAIALLQEQGLTAFSVRRLAARLGVDPMAIYKHVRNKDDLLGAAMAAAFRDARPAGETAWWEQIAATLREHRRVIHAQPWLLDLVTQQRISSAEPWAGAESALAIIGHELGEVAAGRWLRLLLAFTNGFLLTEPELRGGLGDADAFLADRPLVIEAARRLAASGDADFETGLALLIDAMRAEAGRR